jgi:hypothetical protein
MGRWPRRHEVARDGRQRRDPFFSTGTDAEKPKNRLPSAPDLKNPAGKPPLSCSKWNPIGTTAAESRCLQKRENPLDKRVSVL